jgi:hypothetical protein
MMNENYHGIDLFHSPTSIDWNQSTPIMLMDGVLVALPVALGMVCKTSIAFTRALSVLMLIKLLLTML